MFTHNTLLRERSRGALTAAVAAAFLLCRGGLPADAAPTSSSAAFPGPGTALHNVTFVIFDTETTGFRSSKDRIVEVGAVKVRDGKIVEEKSWLINPERKIPFWARKVHGITDEMVKDRPTFADVYPEFRDFIKGAVLMAHNARFDIAFIGAEARRAGSVPPRNPVVDSLALFRKWFPDSKSHSLDEVARDAHVEAGDFHRALADSMYVFLILDKALKANPDVDTLRDLYRASGGALRF